MKKKKLSLSIIVPVYNEENSLLTILSKLNDLKKLCKIEIIVVNDGSKDNSKTIIDKVKFSAIAKQPLTFSWNKRANFGSGISYQNQT